MTVSMPFKGSYPVTQIWGQIPGAAEGSRWPDGHDGHPGVDYGCPNGTQILAIADGQVIYAGPASGFGDHLVSIYHPIFGITSRYGHMQAQLVNTGDKVVAGQPIGISNNEGDSSGAHLHLETGIGEAIDDGNPPNIDPVVWLYVHLVSGPTPPEGIDIMASMRTIDTNVQLNMQDPIVRTAEALLGARGAWINPANAQHPIFATATKWFQTAAGLKVDGIIGQTTWQRLVLPLNGK